MFHKTVCIVLFSALFAQVAVSMEERVLFLSIPKSGTNLITCSLSFLTNRPIGLYPDRLHPKGNERLGVDMNNPPLFYRTHVPKRILKERMSGAKLLLLSRNYKEHLYRQFQGRKISRKSLNNYDVRDFISNFLSYYRLFDSWPKENRLLIYYEDFIEENNREVFEKILSFLNIQDVEYAAYAEKRKEIEQKIYGSYVQQHSKEGKSRLKEPRKKFYSSQADRSTLKAIDAAFRKRDASIFKKYLDRFEEK